MNKVYISFVVILLVVIGGIYMYVSDSDTSDSNLANLISSENDTTSTNTESQQTASVNKIEVKYNGTSFVPQRVTVKRGDSVVFVNESSGGMSVASDPHPAHTIYPEFDQYKSTARGQSSYTFTFDKIGSWGYHNHLNSSAVGSVVVTE